MAVYTLYILECVNGSYYSGYTTDLTRRYAEHQQGSAKCKYTRSFPPKRIAAAWELDCDLQTIYRLERALKRLTRQQKQHLLQKYVIGEADDIDKYLMSYRGLTAVSRG